MVGAMQAIGYFASDPACGLPIGGGTGGLGVTTRVDYMSAR